MNRLFCYSIFSRNGRVDDYVLYYLKALTECGDVIVYADNDNYQTSIDKIKSISPNILYVGASKHGEYDFGSYKRCIQKAQELDIIDNYDYIYICNDSVIGPLSDLNTLLQNLEGQKKDLVCMYEYLVKGLEGPQSWFLGVSKPYHKKFINFLLSVTKEDHKDDVVIKYEHGLGVEFRECSIAAEVSQEGLRNFFNIEAFLEEFPTYPFIKKRALCYLKKMTLKEFLEKYIKDSTLRDNILSIFLSIQQHEYEMAPKYGGCITTKESDNQFSFQFVIPKVNPAKKAEQKYF